MTCTDNETRTDTETSVILFLQETVSGKVTLILRLGTAVMTQEEALLTTVLKATGLLLYTSYCNLARKY